MKLPSETSFQSLILIQSWGHVEGIIAIVDTTIGKSGWDNSVLVYNKLPQFFRYATEILPIPPNTE